MSLPQATSTLGSASLKPLQPPVAATTTLETIRNGQNSIPPLQPASLPTEERTDLIEPLRVTSADQTHRSVVWGVASTTIAEGQISTQTPGLASHPPSTSSEIHPSLPASAINSPSPSVTSSSWTPPTVVVPSILVGTPSQESVISYETFQATSSLAPVTSQIASVTPYATIYGSYNPSDYYVNIATSSFPGATESSDADIAASRAKANPKTAVIVVGALAGGLFFLMFVLLVFVRYRDRRKMSAGTRELLEPTYGATISASPDPRAARRRPAGSRSPVDRLKRDSPPV